MNESPAAVLTFDGDTFTGLYTDLVPLHEIGVYTARRVSNVEFNPDTQQWEVRWVDQPDIVAFSHAERHVCLNWERENYRPNSN